MIPSAVHYHRKTAYDRSRMNAGGLDWSHQPSLFKTYEGVDILELPREVSLPTPWLSELLKGDAPSAGREGATMKPEDLSRILQLTYSLTARAKQSGGGDFFFRSAASAGALYPTEIYVATRGVEGLEDGLYHFSIARHGLAPLRSGDLSAYISRLLRPQTGGLQVTFFLSAIFFRSAWKYRDRAYRYHLLDTGHVLEHLILSLRAMGLPHTCTFDFDDHGVNRLLGLDETREATLVLVGTGAAAGTEPEDGPPLPELSEIYTGVSRMAREEDVVPLILEMHESSCSVVHEAEPVETAAPTGPPVAAWEDLRAPLHWPERVRFPDAVFQRRSRRNFVPVPLPRQLTVSLLEGLCATDSFEPDGCLEVGFLVEQTTGFVAGFHLLDRAEQKTGLVRAGNFLHAMASSCLNQEWLKNAAIHFLFMADLESLDRRWGPRGYRHAMLTAGRLGERIYLAATSLGLGCCGVGAFYDREAHDLLGLEPGWELLYLVAAGPVKGES